MTKATAVASVAAGLAVLSAGPASAQTLHGVSQVTCGTRTDWLRLYTVYHGNPVCYATTTAGGQVWYGSVPPSTTWTATQICPGNNQGDLTYWFKENGTWHQVAGYRFFYNTCENFEAELGETIEVEQISIYSR